MKIFIKMFFIVSNGTYILINVPITINGPNGIYSLDFLIFVINSNTLNIAPIKNDNSVITMIFDSPNSNPNDAISFTSPNPIASFP